ncbi:Erp5p NDAI_0C01640 [Naumovozyma dairenensis CBS 421]|uniref:GOLD domain-containing protein n=1 Tax=Naumovozyma dairenensis (strain ATCC 10597 / BCRC 20456 / CBS 421 / NBRC 0211 / NRRL Y-12639) TaxID=1071378 RepID=G0W7R4_NAUDC|nr:hypothetical protein NDAI_0C01640 [Naumovozyma dairenensis CBS 421]CCD23825.1 hypothetical protein NDAI_0C01640 [Naumovozyma dairenensis CBS 421]
MLLQQLRVFTLLLSLASFGSCIYFYANSGEVRCFYENLSSGQLLIADIDTSVEKNGIYEEDQDVTVSISVDETFDNNHRVLNQKNSHTGDFAFTALDDGEHRVCFTPYFADTKSKIRVFVELEIDHVSSLDSQRKEDVESMKRRTSQLIGRLNKIRQEQKEIRENEAIFRDESEAANSKIRFWSILQVIVLIVICWFQLGYLRNFFIKQKVL